MFVGCLPHLRAFLTLYCVLFFYFSCPSFIYLFLNINLLPLAPKVWFRVFCIFLRSFSAIGKSKWRSFLPRADLFLWGNDSCFPNYGVGTINWTKTIDGNIKTLSVFLLVPGMKQNLISMGTLDSKGARFQIKVELSQSPKLLKTLWRPLNMEICIYALQVRVQFFNFNFIIPNFNSALVPMSNNFKHHFLFLSPKNLPCLACDIST